MGCSSHIHEVLQTPVCGRYDVIVAGGGPAGTGAAISAARLGKKVLLIERYGFLGGNWTAALVNPFPYVQYEERGGIVHEIVNRLKAEGAWGGWIDRCFDFEAMKRLLDTMMIEAGVDLLLHSWVADVVKDDNQVTGVIVENKSGRGAWLADVVIDCTGDGDAAARAGAEFVVGRASDGLTQPMTLMFKISGTNFNQTDKSELFEMFREVVEREGLDYDYNFRHPYVLVLPGKDKAICQITHIRRLNGADARDLTEAEIEGRRRVYAVFNLMKRHIERFADIELEETGSQIGVRESRRILGDYVLIKEDLEQGRQFEDGIVDCFNHMDIHEPDGEDMVYHRVEPYQIPYRCLLPKGLDGILTAGRCISGTHESLAAYRLSGVCVALGQGAGTAASLALDTGTTVREISIPILRESLIKQGVLGLD